MANKIYYSKTSFIGGGGTALDSIDGAGLVDGDFAHVVVDGKVHIYKLDGSSGAAESSPNIISPDANAGTKRWERIHGGFKVGSFSRDLATASGNQAVTGVGFKPSVILSASGLAAAGSGSVGFGGGASNYSNIYSVGGASWYASVSYLATIAVDISNFQMAIIASMDTDGFTVTWTKTGSPTGTGYVTYMAIQ